MSNLPISDWFSRYSAFVNKSLLHLDEAIYKVNHGTYKQEDYFKDCARFNVGAMEFAAFPFQIGVPTSSVPVYSDNISKTKTTSTAFSFPVLSSGTHTGIGAIPFVGATKGKTCQFDDLALANNGTAVTFKFRGPAKQPKLPEDLYVGTIFAQTAPTTPLVLVTIRVK